MRSWFRAVLFLPLMLLPLLAAATELAAETSALIRSQIAQLEGEAAEGVVELSRFYALRGDAPAWDDPAHLERLVVALETLHEDGLEPADYEVALLRTLAGENGLGERVFRDVLATRALLRALGDLAYGRLDPARVEPFWQAPSAPLVTPDRGALVELVQTGVSDPMAALERARPALPQYLLLRGAFARMRAVEASGGWPTVAAGPTLRPAALDRRVEVLHERLRAEGYDTGTVDGERYQGALVEAVRAFQHDNRLAADGVVGAATLAALNVPAAARVGQLRVNLERLRWFARVRETGFVLVDVAGAAIAYFRNGEPVWRTRAQVGRPERATPLLKSEITHFTFNPTWTVPPTILREDKLPLIRRDPSYLERNRMKVIGPDGRVIPPGEVDWSHPGGVMLRQDAGPDNALGEVAIRFPNPFAVYLHDTPSRSLFAREQRTTSSGCVRVEHALELVGLLSADGGGPDADTVATILASRRTRNVSLARPVPILIAYWTAAVGSEGRVVFRPDIYGLDPALLQALAAPRQALSAQLRALPVGVAMRRA